MPLQLGREELFIFEGVEVDLESIEMVRCLFESAPCKVVGGVIRFLLFGVTDSSVKSLVSGSPQS